MESLLERLPAIFAKWGFELKCCHPELSIAGSPERALKREILEDSHGELFVLEQLPLANREIREAQARCQRFLVEQGMEGVSPWLSPVPGSFGVECEGFFWQLRHWSKGVALPRETYAQDAWRGEATAQFLLNLRKCSDSEAMPGRGGRVFTLMHYIGHLMTHFQRQLSALVTDMKPMVAELREYHDYEHTAQGRFCHGDLHPGNIIWGERKIQTVIDWEFCGPKPAAYDLANLLGCLGMDDPAFLTGPYAMTCIQALRKGAFLTEEEWHFLPDQIAALRFGWMREWVARKDKPMITQELDFIWLILDNRELLRQKWR